MHLGGGQSVVCVMQGPILAFVYAVKELIEESRDTGGSLPVNVAFAFEGEEENGSGGFRETIKANLHWFEGTQLIIISNTLWVGEEVRHLMAKSHRHWSWLKSVWQDGIERA